MTVGRSARDLLGTLAVWSKKNEALPPQSASNVAVWRSKTRPDIGTSFRANFGFIRRCFHCIAQRIVLDLLIQVTSLLGWCSLRRFICKNKGDTPGVFEGKLGLFQQCGVKKTNLLTSILLGDDLFQRHPAKKNGQCGPQNGA